MTWLEALAVSAGLLLAATGAAKTARPDGLAAALFAAGLTRGTRPTARSLAAVELIVGTAVVLHGGPGVLLAAAGLYAGFTAFVLWGLAAPQRITSCGCSGRSDTPPTAGHAVVNGAATAVLLAATAGGGVTQPATAFADQPLLTAVLLADAAVVALLAWAVITVAPRVSPRPAQGRSHPGALRAAAPHRSAHAHARAAPHRETGAGRAPGSDSGEESR